MQVVVTVRKLLHLAPLPLQLCDLQLQLCEEPLRPLLRRCLLPLERLQQLRLTTLQRAEQGGVNLHAQQNVPPQVFLKILSNEKRKKYRALFNVCSPMELT